MSKDISFFGTYPFCCLGSVYSVYLDAKMTTYGGILTSPRCGTEASHCYGFANMAPAVCKDHGDRLLGRMQEHRILTFLLQASRQEYTLSSKISCLA